MATKKKTTKDSEVSDVKKTRASTIVLGPRITEKAAGLSEKSMYTFNVAKNATKNEIVQAIKTLYDVTPIKIAVINRKSKEVFSRGNWGVKSGGRKAIVTVKKGDKIAFM